MIQYETILCMKKHLFSFLIFSLITCIITYPLIFHLTNYVFGKGDELLISWIMNWDIHSLFTNPLKIFNTNIFYPYQNTLAFSDSFFTSAIIGLVPFSIFREPLIVYNINVLTTLTFLAFFTYLFVYFITNNIYSSFMSGLLASFSPFILGRLFQLQVVSIYWIPLSLLFFFRFLKRYSTLDFLFMCIFFLLQITNSLLPGYFLLFSYIIILGFYAIKKQVSWKGIFQKKIIIIVAVTGLITFIIGLPYLKTSKTFNYTRNIRDTIHFAARPEYTFFPNNKTRLQQLILSTVYKNDKGPYKYDGYWGLGLILLSLFSFFYYKRTYRKHKIILSILFLIAAFSFVLSLGPAFQWGGKVIKHPFIIPLPYAVVYYLIPGFQGFRNSARWEVLTVLMASMIVGITISSFLKKKSTVYSVLFTIIVSLIVLGEINFPFSYQSMPTVKQFPIIHQYIQTLPQDSKLIYLPIYPWNIQPYSNLEFEREFYSTLHFKTMVNGYSGFSPLAWESMAAKTTLLFPDNTSIIYLKKIGITHIIINMKEYSTLHSKKYLINGQPVPSVNELLDKIQKFPELKLIKKVEDNYIYQLIV